MVDPHDEVSVMCSFSLKLCVMVEKVLHLMLSKLLKSVNNLKVFFVDALLGEALPSKSVTRQLQTDNA